jgi:hypothetical protein
VVAPLRSIRRPVTIALWASLALQAAPSSSGAFAGRNGAIVYEGSASQQRGYLYVRDTDRRRSRRVRATVGASAPSVSPLGRRIAFSSGSRLWVVQADGTGLRRVSDIPLRSRTPTWSPAGDALGFAGGPRRSEDIYRIGADGGRLLRLTYARADEEAPAWSARDRIAFVRRSRRGDGDLFWVPARGGPAERLTGGKADDGAPAWSPDGRSIVFTRGAPGVRDVYVMRANGSRPQKLTSLRRSAQSPVWSPDGRSIAFAASGGQGRRSLYIMRRDGRRLRRLGSSASDPRWLDWQPTGFDPVVAAAGDIACDPASRYFGGGLGLKNQCAQRLTSDLLLRMDLDGILTLGDLQYEDGQLAKFAQSFEPTWGRLKPLLHPVVGNHEYRVRDAAGYFDYFNGVGRTGGAAGTRGQGYYSFDIGSWHLLALNSQCASSTPTPGAPSCAAGSPQARWLQADLAAHPGPCTLAFWHHPLVSSGFRRFHSALAPLWQALADRGVDVLLAGHDHAYERFGPMSSTGAPDPVRGLRQFVVGTGGKNFHRAVWRAPNSESRRSDSHGVLQMTLRPLGYSWSFVDVRGRVLDAGSDDCR